MLRTLLADRPSLSWAIALLLPILSGCSDPVPTGMLRITPTEVFGANPDDLAPLVGFCGAWTIEGTSAKRIVLMFYEVWKDGKCIKNDPAVGSGRAGIRRGPVQESVQSTAFAAFQVLPAAAGSRESQVLVTFGEGGVHSQVVLDIPTGGKTRVTGMRSEPIQISDDEDVVLAAMCAGRTVLSSDLNHGMPRHTEGGSAIYLKLRLYESD